MVVLVTGSTGRVGLHLVNALLTKKERVRILVRKNSKIQKFKEKNAEIFYGDLLDKASLEKALNGVDVVYHLAAVVGYLPPKKLVYNVNVVGTKNLFDAVNKNKVKKVIFLSSTAVYGKKLAEIPANENTLCKPTDYYGWTKLQAEVIARKNKAIILRSVDVYGGGFEEGYYFVFSQLEKGKLPILGNGENFIQYIHINDLIRAMLLARTKGVPGEVYVVAGKDVMTQKDLFKLICKYLNVAPPKKHISIVFAKLLAYAHLFRAKVNRKKPKLIPEYISKLVANRKFDISKAKRELGYKPKVGYNMGIQKMIEEYKFNK